MNDNDEIIQAIAVQANIYYIIWFCKDSSIEYIQIVYPINDWDVREDITAIVAYPIKHLHSLFFLLKF